MAGSLGVAFAGLAILCAGPLEFGDLGQRPLGDEFTRRPELFGDRTRRAQHLGQHGWQPVWCQPSARRRDVYCGIDHAGGVENRGRQPGDPLDALAVGDAVPAFPDALEFASQCVSVGQGFLAGRTARAVTGQVLYVCGGKSLYAQPAN
jgi:hypothetical protein